MSDQPSGLDLNLKSTISICQQIKANSKTIRIFICVGLGDEDIAMIQSIVKKGNELPGDPGDEHR